jgi:hypothetical protein
MARSIVPAKMVVPAKILVEDEKEDLVVFHSNSFNNGTLCS